MLTEPTLAPTPDTPGRSRRPHPAGRIRPTAGDPARAVRERGRARRVQGVVPQGLAIEAQVMSRNAARLVPPPHTSGHAAGPGCGPAGVVSMPSSTHTPTYRVLKT